MITCAYRANWMAGLVKHPHILTKFKPVKPGWFWMNNPGFAQPWQYVCFFHDQEHRSWDLLNEDLPFRKYIISHQPIIMYIQEKH